eukprot:jgi/Ulvmu1/10257/UM060_0058.1
MPEGAESMHPSLELSQAVWYGVHDSHHCGYCKKTRPGHRVSAGMVAKKLTVYAYQELLDVGWRRSGTYVYHADPPGTCCPAYTIRLDATQFTPTAAQRRVLRRFESFCSGEWARRQRAKGQQPSVADEQPAPNNGVHGSAAAPAEQADAATSPVDLSATQAALAERCSSAVTHHLRTCSTPELVAALDTAENVFTVKQPVADCSGQAGARGVTARPQPCRALSPTPALSKNKAKKARKAAAKAAAAAGAAAVPSVSAVATDLAMEAVPAVQAALAADAAVAALAPDVAAERGHLRVTLRVPAAVPAAASPALRALLQPSPAAAGAARSAHDSSADMRACSTGAAGASAPAVASPSATSGASMPPPAAGEQSDEESLDSDADWSPRSSEPSSEPPDDAAAERPKWWLTDPPDGSWQLRMELKPCTFDEAEFQLYQRYQRVVHGDPPFKVSRRGFQRFLVDTPWEGTVPRAEDGDAPDCGYGAFHMQYWLGPHLIAVGVWDILPRCLSSKYFIWDPDLPFLSLGKLSALKEIEWVRAAHAAGARTLHYVYFGLYIHSNQKMRYKAEYQPSDLLCPSSHAWVPCADQLLRALDTHDGTADLSALVPPHAAPPPAIPPCSLRGGPFATMPWLPALQATGAFAAEDVLVLAQGTLARMRHWLEGRVSDRAAGQLRRLADEVASHMGPRAASQICIVFD